jgi:hypothetical protein
MASEVEPSSPWLEGFGHPHPAAILSTCDGHPVHAEARTATARALRPPIGAIRGW